MPDEGQKSAISAGFGVGSGIINFLGKFNIDIGGLIGKIDELTDHLTGEDKKKADRQKAALQAVADAKIARDAAAVHNAELSREKNAKKRAMLIDMANTSLAAAKVADAKANAAKNEAIQLLAKNAAQAVVPKTGGSNTTIVCGAVVVGLGLWLASRK